MAKKVFVGLSGGVDSAVSAALLQQEGYDVVGAFIKIWRPEFTECTWKEDRIDAMRVAAALQIPFCEIDLSDEYKHDVVDSMIRDYESGITPNPDVLCNLHIKFGAFFKWARAEGADYVATGHYAQILERNGQYQLHRSQDAAKDQSYFLHQLSGTDLPHILFPVGGMQKSEVRSAAKRFGLPVANRPDSQGLCFVGDVSIPEFLGRFMKLTVGDVLDMSSEVIGTHDGAVLYTIGQRHGFTTTKNMPMYVARVDVKENTIRVSPNREDATSTRAHVRDMHWINPAPPTPIDCFTQARYHETPIMTRISKDDGAYTAAFEDSRIIAPGQSLVLYDDTRCLGGGIIAKESAIQ